MSYCKNGDWIEQMNTDYSSAAFFDFLDYLSAKGIMKPSTVTARRAAAKAIFEILDSEDVADLRDLDVDQAVTRFANLKGNGFTPGSLKSYKSRFAGALSDFLAYKANPLAFKPGVTPRQRRSKAQLAPKQEQAETYAQESGPRALAQQETLVFPIPLRPNVVVQVAGIPSDLTTAEARKISAVITALGASSEDGAE